MKPSVHHRGEQPTYAFLARYMRRVPVVLQGLVVCSGLVLAGCATSPDPHQGGFVNGLVGLAGGGYERRIEDREQTYRAELTAQDQLQAQARQLERERAAVRSELDQASQRMRALEARIQRERRLLAAQRSEAARANRVKLDQAEKRLGTVKTALGGIDLDAQSIDTSKHSVRSLENQLSEIDSLVEISSAGL